mmetsp:Transcript_85383/g.170442  ORF Transcript_85383/g.170442 Transcript_85383/m.170442 type:complete len:383 (-) Transcript_85383:493-1641(-)
MRSSASLASFGSQSDLRRMQLDRLRRIGSEVELQADQIMNSASKANAMTASLSQGRLHGGVKATSSYFRSPALPGPSNRQLSKPTLAPIASPPVAPPMAQALAPPKPMATLAPPAKMPPRNHFGDEFHPDAGHVGPKHPPRAHNARGQKVTRRIKDHVDMKYQSLHKAFRSMDDSQDQRLSSDEILKAVAAWNLNCSPEDIEALMQSCDENGDGHIDYAEFQRGMAKLEQARTGEVFGRSDTGVVNNFHGLGNGQVIFNDNLQYASAKQIGVGQMAHSHSLPQAPVDKASVADLKSYISQFTTKVDAKYRQMTQAFRSIDEDKNGYLSREELVKAVENFALPIPLSHVHQIFDDVSDVNSDGKLSYDEFANLLRKVDLSMLQ